MWRITAQELRLVAVALQFLTRIPVRLATWDDAWLNACVRHFPLVGAFVGLVGGAVLLGAGQLWSPWVAAALAVASTVVLTGGFHEDGLADTFDALGGVVSRERALTIMKDSRIGSYGALALVISLLLRVGLLVTVLGIGPHWALAACALSHGLGRAAAVAVMAGLPYGGDADHAKAKPLASQVDWRQTLGASAWVVLLLVVASALLALPLPSLVAAVLAAAGTALLMRGWLRRRLGGYTGDGLGATEQLTEIAVLLALSARGIA